MIRPAPDRRTLLRLGAGLLGSAALAGCDRLPNTGFGRAALQAGEDASLFAQRLLLSPARLAPEYVRGDLSPQFKANGTVDPPDRDYKALARRRFADYRLVVDGLVNDPARLSLRELRAMPARTQITRHDCVEGWSCIGEWTGVQLSTLLGRVGLKPEARYVVLHCFDTMEGGTPDDDSGSNPQLVKRDRAQQSASGGPSQQDQGLSEDSSEGRDEGGSEPIRYYESIDLEDAYHPQTILAYGMNGVDLPVAHGAPLRLRLERQLGYKMAKYVRRLEVVSDLKNLGGGRGGYWEDRGYDWYAGI